MKTWSLIAKHLQENSCCALVTMVEVLGSAPREAGTRMVIRPDGGFHGTIGGGTLEWRVLADAQKLMRNSHAQLSWKKYALGPELGQCCGGVVKLLIEVFEKSQLPEIKLLAEQENLGPFSTIGHVAENKIHREINPETSTDLTHLCLSSDGNLYESYGQKKRSVYLFGAGHVGRAMMLSMASLDFDLTWIDSRENALPSMVPGNVAKVFTPSPVSTLNSAPDEAFVVILTHSHSLDLDLVNAALSEDRFGYVGVIGSTTKKARFRNRLRDAGLEKNTIDKLVCPIGIEGINSKHPAAIAASVIAELLVKDEELALKQQYPQLKIAREN
ncbi:xanthine dehydrogenase accessory protein XdhC [Kiloniella antarctica]|uniref:Xanthine dehydrogenase accessory protein XdhC n=1 Tax=Kiloniella antarctica TaxID=1550907 RepID=A0ABW5BH55_9PROT